MKRIIEGIQLSMTMEDLQMEQRVFCERLEHKEFMSTIEIAGYIGGMRDFINKVNNNLMIITLFDAVHILNDVKRDINMSDVWGKGYQEAHIKSLEFVNVTIQQLKDFVSERSSNSR